MSISKRAWMAKFSANLAGLMEERDISQKNLAMKAHITQAALSRYINMRRIPDSVSVINIARALDCDIEDLIDMGTYVVEDEK